jgi:hypothetical protein
MLLLYAILFIEFEAIGEALVKRHFPAISGFVFRGWVQWVIAILLFALWFCIALKFDNYFVPTWKIIMGFVFVRFMIFDVSYNIASGLPIKYYGTTKLYDRIMTKLGSWGWFVKFVCGVMGACFLLGYS